MSEKVDSITAWSERVRLWAHNLDTVSDHPTAPFTRSACIEELNTLLGRHSLRLVEGGAPSRHHPPVSILPVETLTEEERALLEAYRQARFEGMPNATREAAAKLLRIHDRLWARVGQLERS